MSDKCNKYQFQSNGECRYKFWVKLLVNVLFFGMFIGGIVLVILLV